MEVLTLRKAEILKDLILKDGTSIRSFSEKAGIPYTTLRSILERGVGKASVDNVLKICKALGITAEQLDDMSNGIISTELKDTEEIHTIAAHHDGEDWTEDELKDIEEFKKFVLSKRKK